MSIELCAEDFEELSREATRIRNEGREIDAERVSVRQRVAHLRETVKSQAAEMEALEVALAGFAAASSSSKVVDPAGTKHRNSDTSEKKRKVAHEDAEEVEDSRKRKMPRTFAPTTSISDRTADPGKHRTAGASSRSSRSKKEEHE
ncbi:hypothetical protein DFH06DRAFT_1293351 [Mycena polygramma]|nr:hypothetical protein DFH06DRAFT_1293351 [Mycena polygramma]